MYNIRIDYFIAMKRINSLPEIQKNLFSKLPNTSKKWNSVDKPFG